MATLEEQRRASGQRMQDQRRSSGQRMEAERRAGGQRMIEERTGKSLADDINSLVTPPRTRKTLRTVEPRGALPAQRGRGSYQAPAATGGMSSPLVEQDYALRQFWPGGMPSSDGLLILPAWRRVVMTDANGDEHFFDYAEPV